MFRVIFLAGASGALAFILYFYVIFLLFQNPFLVNPKSLDFFIYAGAIVGGLYYMRQNVLQKYMNFWQGFGSGILQTMIMAGLCSLFLYFFLYYEKKPLQLYVQDKLDEMQKVKENIVKNIGEKLYTEIYNNVKKTTPYEMAWFEWRTKMVLGIFIAFVTSLVLRRKKNSPLTTPPAPEGEQVQKGGQTAKR